MGRFGCWSIMRDLSACQPFGLRGPFPSVPLAAIIAGLPGLLAWYDPSDLSTLFQDAAGTTPVTSAGDPVGLMLDKSQGLARGADLWSRADVAVGTIWVESGGVWTKGSTGNATLGLTTLSADSWYEWTFTIDASTGNLNVWRRNQADTANEQAAFALGTGTHTVIVKSGPVANGEGHYLWLDGSAFTGTFSSLAIREVPGNHLTAPSDAARPVYQTDGVRHWLEFDGVDDEMATAAALPFSTTVFTAVAFELSSYNAAFPNIIANRRLGSAADSSQPFVYLKDGDDQIRMRFGDQLPTANYGSSLVNTPVVLSGYADGADRALDIGTASDSTTGNFLTGGSTEPFVISGGNRFNGRFYGTVHGNTIPAPSQIAQVRQWFARMSGGVA